MCCRPKAFDTFARARHALACARVRIGMAGTRGHTKTIVLMWRCGSALDTIGGPL